MGNQNSSNNGEGSNGTASSKNVNNVNKNGSKIFKPLKSRDSATDKFTLKLYSEEVISLYETAQENLKSKMKTVYSNQDEINKRISSEKIVCEKIVNQQKKEMQKSSVHVVSLRNNATDLKTMIDSTVVDVQALFARAEELDRNLEVLETKVDL